MSKFIIVIFFNHVAILKSEYLYFKILFEDFFLLI